MASDRRKNGSSCNNELESKQQESQVKFDLNDDEQEENMEECLDKVDDYPEIFSSANATSMGSSSNVPLLANRSNVNQESKSTSKRYFR
jgi:hypothetical protein